MYRLLLIMVLVGGAVETYEKDIYEKEAIESYDWDQLEKEVLEIDSLNCEDFLITLPEEMVVTSTGCDSDIVSKEMEVVDVQS
jgi:hypothetical protein